MVERQARDLEVRVRIPAPVQIFLLKFMKKTKCNETRLIVQLLLEGWREGYQPELCFD